MTTMEVERPALSASGGVTVRTRLFSVCVAHGVVDFFSAVIVPLLSVLEGGLRLTPAQGAVLIGVGSLASGAIQPVVAWLSDRHDTRVLGTIGFGVAVLAIGSVGFARSYTDLLIIQILGASGIGAFHPVAAAAMGHLSGARRSMGVAVFFTAGMVGGIGGSVLTPFYNQFFGLKALAWLMIPGMIAVALLAWATHSVGHRTVGARERHGSLSGRERRWRWTAVGLLYFGNAARFTVNMAVLYLIVRWCEQTVLERAGATALDEPMRAAASTINGPMQGAMAVGMGMGGLALGMFVRVRHERLALVAAPCLGALPIVALAHVSGPLAFVLAALCGVGFAGVIPITIAMAQRLLPHRTGLASGLMMGGAWSLAAVGPVLAEWLYGSYGLSRALEATAGLLVVAGALGMFLPGWLIQRSAE